MYCRFSLDAILLNPWSVYCDQEGMEGLRERVAEIVEEKLEADPKLLDMPNESLVEELMEEVERCV